MEILSKMSSSIIPLKADVITSRAFGKLDHLLKISYKHQNRDTTALFPKGVSLRRNHNFKKKLEL